MIKIKKVKLEKPKAKGKDSKKAIIRKVRKTKLKY